MVGEHDWFLDMSDVWKSLFGPAQSRFKVGQAGRDWLQNDLAKVDSKTPPIVFSHPPLYKYYKE